MLPIDDLSCDVLILGAGGAGMLAALHVTTANPRASIVIAVKGLLGQSGCTRMVQHGYNYFLEASFSPILWYQRNDFSARGSNVKVH